MGKGIFYAVSVGAGDPLDMTLRARSDSCLRASK